MQIITHQISRQIDRYHPWATVDHVLDDIGRLATIPGERRQALQLLVNFGIEVWDMTLSHNHGLDRELHLGPSRVRKVQEIHVGMLRQEVAASRLSGEEHWESEMLLGLEDGWERLYRDYIALQDDDDQEDEYFTSSRALLHERHSRRVANLLAERVTGHLLPPELVEMVRDSLLGFHPGCAVASSVGHERGSDEEEG